MPWILKQQLDVRRHNARHWIYPTEVPERAYQLAMIKTALLHNTLVCRKRC
jgi:ERCC4-related helicase